MHEHSKSAVPQRCFSRCARLPTSSGTPLRTSGDLVFIAYGLISSVPKRDGLAGLDLAGNIVIMTEGPPKSVSKADWKQAKAQMEIMVGLVKRGVAGIIYVSNGSEEHPYAEMAGYLTRRQLGRSSG